MKKLAIALCLILAIGSVRAESFPVLPDEDNDSLIISLPGLALAPASAETEAECPCTSSKKAGNCNCSVPTAVYQTSAMAPRMVCNNGTCTVVGDASLGSSTGCTSCGASATFSGNASGRRHIFRTRRGCD